MKPLFFAFGLGIAATSLADDSLELTGTNFYGQLEQHFKGASLPNWDQVSKASTYLGKCFVSENNVGETVGLKFYIRSNGPLLEPSKVTKLLDGGLESKELILNEPESLWSVPVYTTNGQYGKVDFRAKGSTLVMHWYRDENCRSVCFTPEAYCYAEPSN